MSYSKYRVNDFVSDDKFRAWVLQPNPELNYFWEKWLLQNPEKKKEVKEAVEILKAMQFSDHKLSLSRKRKLWDRIDEATSKSEDPKGHRTKVLPISSYQSSAGSKPRSIGYYIRIASVVVLALCLSVWMITNYDQEEGLNEATEIIKSNAKGQKSKIFLPDGSIVHLNAASTLIYTSSFDQERKIELSGEAFFEVKKDTLRPFVVHSGDVTTTALGTSFNINAYGESDQVKVSLISGKVKVNSPGSEIENSLILTPGFAAEFTTTTKILKKTNFDPEKAIGWKDGLIVFENTPLSKVFEELENWYGIEFNVDKMPDSSAVVTGKFDNEYLGNILTGLSYTYRFEYEINDKQASILFESTSETR